MHKVNLSRDFENKQTTIFLKEALQEIPKKNRVFNKEECYVMYNNEAELNKITTVFSAILTERKLVNYLYDYCEFQQMKKESISKFIEAFFMVNPSFISYSLILTKMNLSIYMQFNDELNIEAFELFNMTHLNSDIETLLMDAYVLESVYSVTNSGVMEMVDTFKLIVEIEEMIKDKKVEEIKDFKIYYDKGLKCITETKAQINDEYLKSKYGVELDKKMDEVEKMFILIGLIKPTRVILFSSVPEEIKATLINSGKTFGPALGQIKFFTAAEPKPTN